MANTQEELAKQARANAAMSTGQEVDAAIAGGAPVTRVSGEGMGSGQAQSWLSAIPYFGGVAGAMSKVSENPRWYRDPVTGENKYATSVDPRNAQVTWSRELGNMLNAGPRANPYDARIANQSQGAQEALLAQMRASAAGPSIAALQARQGVGMSNQNAMLQAALGNRRGALLGAQAGGQAMAGDAAQARLAEQLGQQAGIGAQIGSQRGAQQQVFGDNMATSQAMLSADQRRQQFAGSGLNSLNTALGQLDLSNFRTDIAAQKEQARREAELAKETANFIQSMISLGAGG